MDRGIPSLARWSRLVSEYQCYEFVALERPLTAKQMNELRGISTRAEITPTRFWNEYQWGDLKASPDKLMAQYFDAHLYFANWGTHRLMLRIPRNRTHEKSLRAYFTKQQLRVITGHVVVDLCSNTEEPDDFTETPGALATLTPLRTNLMCGDLRCAYLAFLLAVQNGDVRDRQQEPPVPPGLSRLTAPLEAMTEFLRIDPDLIAAAAEESPDEDVDQGALMEWVAGMSPRVKNTWLRRAVDDPELPLGAELLREFRSRSAPARVLRTRTVRELRASAERHRSAREAAAGERARRAKKAADASRKKRLDALGRRLDAAWLELEALVSTSAYDAALTLAGDLRDLAERDEGALDFAARFAAMRKRQLRRRGFFDRWKYRDSR